MKHTNVKVGIDGRLPHCPDCTALSAAVISAHQRAYQQLHFPDPQADIELQEAKEALEEHGKTCNIYQARHKNRLRLVL